MAELVQRGATLVVRGAHVQDAHPDAVGAANLMVIAQALMEGTELDGRDVEGAVRTTRHAEALLTGAILAPGRRAMMGGQPGPIRRRPRIIFDPRPPILDRCLR